MSSEVWNTASMAELLGCSEAAIRTAKSRNKEQLIEGTHWIKDDAGRILWTVAGVQALRELLKSDTPTLPESDTAPLQGGDTQLLQDAVTPDLNIDQQLQPIADEIALQVIEQRLPYLINQSVHRMLASPNEVDTQRLTEMLDRLTHGLAVIKAGTMLVGGLQAAIAASKESLKQLPGGVSNG